MASTSGPAVIVGPPQDRSAQVRSPNRAPLPRRRRRRLALVAVLLVVVSALTAVAMTLATRASTQSYRPVAFRIPSAYSVRYAVTTAGSAPTTEVLSVRRPFDEVDVTYAGTDVSAAPNLIVVQRLGAQVLKAGNGEGTQLRVPATAAPFDVRADIVVPAGLRAHALKAVGFRVVLGRRCQVFRSNRPLPAGALLPLASTSSYTDTCIDAEGLVLRETRIAAGRLLSDRRAVSVATGDAAVAGAPFDLSGSVTPFDSGGGAFQGLTLESRPPGRSLALPQSPSGFQHLGRYAVVPPQPAMFQRGGQGTGTMGLPGGLVTEMDDVYTRGADTVILQQGSTINGAQFKPPANAIDVDLGRLGQGQLLIAGNLTTVVAEPGNGEQFVRMSATLPPDTVIAMMRSLVAQAGGTLTRLSGSSS